MILIVAVDDRNGMMFNNRRQSRDKVLCEKILSLTDGSILWMNHYTQKLFANCDAPQINVDENFLNEATSGEYCFLENIDAAPYEEWVEKIVLFKWNRKYPGDRFFDINVQENGWKLQNTEEFSGSSHEKITMEVYVK